MSSFTLATNHRRKRLILAAPIIAVCVFTVGYLLIFTNSNPDKQPKSPVPKSLSGSVDFPIYYPNQERLPNGYSLDTDSFKRPISNGINYTVSYGNDQNLVFSLQIKPSSSGLQNFEANYIPLRDSYQTPVGEAELGAYDIKGKTETLVSLPVNKTNTWIIITAPYNINQSQLKQVLDSLTK